MMKRTLLSVTLAVAALVIGTARPAKAVFIIDAVETGGDVVFAGSGSVDLTAWTPTGFGFSVGAIAPAQGELSFGGSRKIYSNPVNFAGPAAFGSGSGSLASDFSGFGFVFSANTQTLFTSDRYISGTPFAAAMSFHNADFGTLGMTPGTYEWTWGNPGMGTGDSVRLNVGGAVFGVPEFGSTLLMLGMVVSGLGLALRRHRA